MVIGRSTFVLSSYFLLSFFIHAFVSLVRSFLLASFLCFVRSMLALQQWVPWRRTCLPHVSSSLYIYNWKQPPGSKQQLENKNVANQEMLKLQISCAKLQEWTIPKSTSMMATTIQSPSNLHEIPIQSRLIHGLWRVNSTAWSPRARVVVDIHIVIRLHHHR